MANMVLLVEYFASAAFLRIKLNKFNEDAFKSEKRSINNQNWTCGFCFLAYNVARLLIMSNITMTKLILSTTLFGIGKVTWDLHFIFVHHRVFSQTKELLEKDASEQEKQQDEVICLLTELSTQGPSPHARLSTPINLTEETRVGEETESTTLKENNISPLLDTAFGYQLVMCGEVLTKRRSLSVQNHD